MAGAIQDVGNQVERIWNDLRPVTRHLVERAWQSGDSAAVSQSERVAVGGAATPYDARSDWELGRLLTALDERVRELERTNSAEPVRKARDIAETCVRLLTERTQSAEIFAQLIVRAQERQDYRRIEMLANTLASRLAPSEICEMARSSNAVVRGIAQDVLTHEPAPILAALLRDPIDGDVARLALERQMTDYGTDEAQHLLTDTDRARSNS